MQLPVKLCACNLNKLAEKCSRLEKSHHDIDIGHIRAYGPMPGVTCYPIWADADLPVNWQIEMPD